MTSFKLSDEELSKETLNWSQTKKYSPGHMTGFKAGYRSAEARYEIALKCLEECRDSLSELVDLMEDTRKKRYTPDSFTTQPARDALARIEKMMGEKNGND